MLSIGRYDESTVILPTKCRLKRFTIKGYNVQPHVILLSVYESIYKPYITIHCELSDKSVGGAIKNLGIVAGDEIKFSFDAIEGRTYDGTVHVLAIKGEAKTESLRSIQYTIKGIGPSWFSDQKTIVKQSYKDIPATSVIGSIHRNYIGNDAPLRILESSIGPVDKELYRVMGMKPFKAINDLKDRALYGSVKTGTTMYYRDRDSYVLAPLETMFNQMSSQQDFIQNGTLGRFITDFDRAKNCIIAIHTLVDEEQQTGRAPKIASAGSQEVGGFNLRTKKNTIINPKSFLSGMLGSITGGGSHGGRPNFFAFDSSKLAMAQQPHIKACEENAYSAQLMDGVSFAVKVPINTGINCTVGKGVNLTLIPPQSDLSYDYIGEDMSGVYMITTLVHTLRFDASPVNGYTAFECSRKGSTE